jgi:maltooligosyltrehalose trehalohydrolase
MKVVAYENEKILAIERWDGADRILLIANLNTAPQTASIEGFGGGWRKILDSAEENWRGPGSLTENDFACARGSRISLAPRSFALFHCQRTAP